MQKGQQEPSCLIDFWMQETVRELVDATVARSPLPKHSSNLEISSYLFDFLFTAQDTSTSSPL
jgi:cytochrome P450 family 710 subfamily A protein